MEEKGSEREGFEKKGKRRKGIITLIGSMIIWWPWTMSTYVKTSWWRC